MNKAISIFEHEQLKVGPGPTQLSNDELSLLQRYYGEKGVQYFTLINNGVKFNEYVGVLKIGNLTLEILPKADRNNINSKEDWRSLLISMVRTVGTFNLTAPSSNNLAVKPNAILEMYFELFLDQVEFLTHQGLIKKYSKESKNESSLRGKLLFPEHISKNLVNRTKFFTEHTVYDSNHLINQILLCCLSLIGNVASNPELIFRVSKLQLFFLNVSKIAIKKEHFDKVILNRKSENYSSALEIARMLILNFHPDLIQGKNHVLALMFDMNLLWEKFVLISLRKNLSKRIGDFEIKGQLKKDFWISSNNQARTIRPDILILCRIDGKQKRFILDTKWKNVERENQISLDILRQMYVYHEYFSADKVSIVFPGESLIREGTFNKNHAAAIEKKCALIPVAIGKTIKDLQNNITDSIEKWILEK